MTRPFCGDTPRPELEPELEPLQADFERQLFESARSDGPRAGETERAWLKLAAAAGGVTAVGAAAALGGARSWLHAAPVQAAKWIVIGALGGGSAVGVWLRASAVPEPLPPTRLAAPVPAAPVPAAAVPAGATEAAAPAAAAASEPSSPPRHPPRRSAPTSSATPAVSSVAAAASLTREVAALDSARAALAIGSSDRALRQIRQYQRDFPSGALAVDAEVVAIEALAAEGDQAAALRAAQSFLARHPSDPHAARVREIAARAAPPAP